MVKATSIDFHTLHTNFKSIHCTRIKQLSFPLDSFYSVLTVSGKFQQGWMARARGGQDGGFNF